MEHSHIPPRDVCRAQACERKETTYLLPNSYVLLHGSQLGKLQEPRPVAHRGDTDVVVLVVIECVWLLLCPVIPHGWCCGYITVCSNLGLGWWLGAYELPPSVLGHLCCPYHVLSLTFQGDQGGLRTLQKKWTSFLKARLICSRPDIGLVFNVLQDVFVLRAPGLKEPVFYAVFTPQL